MISAAQSSSLQRAGSASSTGSRVQTDHLSACKSPTIVVDSDLVARLSSSSSSSVHAAGADNAVGEPRAMRRIFADDADWTLSTVPDLVELTIRHIVANFASQYTRARSSSSLT